MSSIPVPAPDAPWWPVISEFALTYNGYDRANGFDGVAEAANQSGNAWDAHCILPDGADECRAALLFEQRRWRHLDQEPHGPAAGFISALVRRIGELSGGSVPSPPDPMP